MNEDMMWIYLYVLRKNWGISLNRLPEEVIGLLPHNYDGVYGTTYHTYFMPNKNITCALYEKPEVIMNDSIEDAYIMVLKYKYGLMSMPKGIDLILSKKHRFHYIVRR